MTYIVVVSTDANRCETTYTCRNREEATRLMLVSMDPDCQTAAVIDTLAGEVIGQIWRPGHDPD